VNLVLSICTHLIKLDEDEEVGEHGAEQSHHILSPHREETHCRQPAFAPIAFRCPLHIELMLINCNPNRYEVYLFCSYILKSFKC
jgi:hypothetical protein